MDTILNLFHSIPSDAYTTVIVAGVVSLVLQAIKKWLAVQSEKVITFLLMILSFGSVSIEYLLGEATKNPALLGPKTFLIMGLTAPIYRYLIKPVTLLAQDAKTYRESLANDNTQQPTQIPIVQEPQPLPTPVVSDEFAAE